MTAARGGARSGAGRKPLGDVPLVRVTVTIDPFTVAAMDAAIARSQAPESLVTFGGRSAFVRDAVRAFLEGLGTGGV